MAEASDTRPAPSAIGKLAHRPLVHLLVYARNRRLTGRLELNAPDGRSGAIELWRGRISDARTAPPIAYFGMVAYELGLIDSATLDATLLEIAKTKRLHGAVLVERGAITPAQRDEILSEQACRKVHHLFSLPGDATFAFYDAVPAAQEPPLALDPIKPAWRGLCESAPTESVVDVLARYATVTLRLSNEGPLGNASLGAEELALCEALSFRSMTIAEMHASSALPPSRVDLLAYFLVITKCAEPAPAAAPSRPNLPAAPISQPAISITTSNMRAAGSGDARVSLSFRVPSAPSLPAAPRSAPRTAATLTSVLGPADLGASGIAHRAQSTTSEDFFEALGLPEGASVDAARAAYFRLAKLWHPDRLPAELEPFRAEVEKIFMHMTQASATLTDPEAHRAYVASSDRSPASVGVPSRPHERVLRDIEQAIAKREFLVAEQTARQLIGLDADDAEAHALAAWAQAHAGEAPEETLRAAIPPLDKAVQMDPHCERAFFYRGVLNKRLGVGSAAFRDFTRVVQLNPRHVDAQREIRIFEMRARKGSGEHALDALILKTKKK